jgi:acetyltransferase-like isoleucine patch superfamily enzyme
MARETGTDRDMKLPLVNTPTFHGHVTFSPSAKFGENCTVWQYATICEDVVIGHEVVIGSGAWIGAGSEIGHGTRIQHGAFIPKKTEIGAFVFIGPNVTLTDDKYPVAGAPYDPHPPVLEAHCSIGAGAVILPGVRVGEGAMIGAGAVVTQDVPPHAVVYGCPARPSA